MDEQYAYDNEGRYYASLTFFLAITGILIVFYNWILRGLVSIRKQIQSYNYRAVLYVIG